MRALALLTVISGLSYSTSATPETESAPRPFLDVLIGRSTNPLYLFKRQSCPSGHTSCSSLGDSAACCPNGTNCARDQNGNIACCPVNAVCTGVISGSAPKSTGSTSGFVLGGSTTATPSTTSPATLPSGYSTVPNTYYPFIQIPSSYPNSQACLSAYTTCQSVSTACFNSLAGQNGVTVSGIGSQGLTQAGVTGTAASSASSICSSLYARGCYGLQSSVCSEFGSGGAGSTQTTSFVQVNAGPAAAKCTGAFYTAAAVVAGVGMAGAAMA